MTISASTKRTLFISDEAYDELIKQGTWRGYIKGTHTAKGISALIKYLMSCDLEDTRPEDVKAQDEVMLENGIAPDWRLYAPRKRRNIELDDDTMFLAAAHCARLGLAYAPAKRILHAPTFMDANACMAALLEAIGTNWIRCDDQQITQKVTEVEA